MKKGTSDSVFKVFIYYRASDYSPIGLAMTSVKSGDSTASSLSSGGKQGILVAKRDNRCLIENVSSTFQI